MSDAISDSNLSRYNVAPQAEDDSQFCLSQLSGYRPDSADLKQKKETLLDGRMIIKLHTQEIRLCNVRDCTLQLIDDLQEGQRMVGVCKAASFCLHHTLKTNAPILETITDNLEIESSSSSKNACGTYLLNNLCPRLDCTRNIEHTLDDSLPPGESYLPESKTVSPPLDFGLTV